MEVSHNRASAPITSTPKEPLVDAQLKEAIALQKKEVQTARRELNAARAPGAFDKDKDAAAYKNYSEAKAKLNELKTSSRSDEGHVDRLLMKSSILSTLGTISSKLKNCLSAGVNLTRGTGEGPATKAAVAPQTGATVAAAASTPTANAAPASSSQAAAAQVASPSVGKGAADKTEAAKPLAVSKPLDPAAAAAVLKMVQTMRFPVGAETLANLHDANINTPTEVVTAYKSLMTTDQFFTALSDAFTKADSPQEKKMYAQVANQWANSPMYARELDNKGFQDFLTLLKADPALKDAVSLPKTTENVAAPASLKTVDSLASFTQGLKPKEVAQEFRSYFSAQQANIPVGDIVTAHKEPKPGAAINLYQLANERSNQLSLAIREDLLSCKSKKEATKKAHFYLEVANEARQSGDFMTLQVIMSSLTNSTIESLELVSKDRFKLLQKLSADTDPSNNFRNLRNLLAVSKDGPTSLMLNLKNITLSAEGNEKYNSDGTVNAKGLSLFSGFIAELTSRQPKLEKESKPTQDLDAFLANSKVTDDILYDRFKQIRPKGAGTEQTGWAL